MGIERGIRIAGELLPILRAQGPGAEMSALPVADPGPMARLEVVKADAGAPSVIFQRLADGESLKEIAKQWAVPKGRFVEWFTTTHTDLYDAALKVRAADLALEAIDIADTPEKGVKTKTRPDGSLEVSEGDMIEHR
ncbi:MAG: hypothetical protein Q8P46_03775, partial [Hyphomicrobiales bacterium]|nr:hypothetical protein [Hyphomicrobiales bacterium]